MAVYEGADILGRALRALVANTEPCYELIIVDNGSTDTTPELLGHVENARVVLNERNTGFGAASNQGATGAQATTVLFLNQDVFVERGWLPPLLERLESNARIGAVGPMLLNPDGSLQSAGAMVYRSGATAPYGEGDSPQRAAYQFARVVDYLPGACVLVRRRAFEKVGGFDSRYGLAYFEDADLALALADRGFRSMYEPRSIVTHVSATPGEQLLALAKRNRAIFERRWRHVLASRPSSPVTTSAARPPASSAESPFSRKR
jgi:O-antigen biosynthesis protein